jgi:hypothetical protein
MNMNWHIVVALAVIGAGVTAASTAAHASGFYDGCSPDWRVNPDWYEDGRLLPVGPAATNVNRAGCPWFITDVQGTVSKRLEFWPVFVNYPSDAQSCNGARYSYVVARFVSGVLYETLAYGNLTGRWYSSPWSSFCAFDVTSGTSAATIQSSSNVRYRFLLRAWNPNGSDRSVDGRIGINRAPVE